MSTANFYKVNASKYCKLLLTLPEGKFYQRPAEGGSVLVYKSGDGNYSALMMPVYINPENIGMDAIKS